MEDVQDALTPGKVATARNERWYPHERGFTSDEADVAYDEDGIMIVRDTQTPCSHSLRFGNPLVHLARHHRQGLSLYWSALRRLR